MAQLYWVYKNAVVDAINEAEPVCLTASDIYNAEFKGIFETSHGELSGPPSESLDIKFSKFPVDLTLAVVKDDSGDLVVELVARSTEGATARIRELSVLDRDHLVIESHWYPIARGAIEQVFDDLASLQIKNLGQVNLSAYLRLVSAEGVEIELDVLAAEAMTHGAYVVDRQVPGALQAKLYPYQESGYSYLSMLYEEGIGGILADEMGLGKTLQIIALVLSKKDKANNPFLVVAPATLLENWRREIDKFAPTVSVYVHQGTARTGNYRDLTDFDVIVTSYDTVLRDLSMLNMMQWDLIILDEAQAIKNPTAKRTDFLKQMNRRLGIAVTGTPVENSLTDLWSIMDFCVPGLLGSQSEFEQRYSDDSESALLLEPCISPLILRRRVAEVAKDLPERLDIVRYVSVSQRFAECYENLRTEIMREYEGNAGLVSIAKLRMLCASASLVSDIIDPIPSEHDYKRLMLHDILASIRHVGEKAIIFTSFTEMITILVKEIESMYPGSYVNFIDGRVPVSERQTIVDAFSAASGFGVLMLNPRAAGTGLNITAANHVIHYNPEWNPALEDQSSARAYRRGQSRPVSVYKLIYSNTVEEVINERLDAKRELSETAIIGNEGVADSEYILRALQISPGNV